MNTILTSTEMRKRFARQWVLLGNPRFDKSGRLRSGTVLAHSPNREQVYRALRETTARCIGVEYLGDVPADLAVAL